MLRHHELIGRLRDENGVHSYKYRLHRVLGKGAYASVYLTECIDISNGRPSQVLACKVIDPSNVTKEYLTKFLPRELEVLRKVNHPHIIRLHAIYKRGSRYFIFMRYAENNDLLDFIIKNGEVVETQARLWVKQLALAVQYLHELEVAHRDLKCENILVTANYNVKLTDMGFARFLLNERGERELSETYCGSTTYAAPEIIKKIPYDPKAADMWSFGVVMFVMMNKALPFQDFTIRQLYMQQIAKKWKLKPEVAAKASWQVKELLKKLLEPEPSDRYTILDVLESEWIAMDPRVLGMTDEERFALSTAKEDRLLFKPYKTKD